MKLQITSNTYSIYIINKPAKIISQLTIDKGFLGGCYAVYSGISSQILDGIYRVQLHDGKVSQAGRQQQTSTKIL
jgi:hypothetical protein